MTQLSQEILAYSRACEHLLSIEMTLNDEESSLVEYYVQEIARKFSIVDRLCKSGSTTMIHKPRVVHDDGH